MVAAAACEDDAGGVPAEEAPHALCGVRPDLCSGGSVAVAGFSAPVTVAPNDKFPAEVLSQVAHNNLDVAWHDPDGAGPEPGRLFFAFRTAPTHFAGTETVMWVVSSPDLENWRLEGKVAIGTDVREPQLVSVGGVLRFYYVELGSRPTEFEPHGTRVATWLGPGQFSAFTEIFAPDFLAWRIRPMARPGEREPWLYVFGYTGGANIYDNDGEPIAIHWLRSRDGLAWEPVVPGQSVVLEGGASETDGVFLGDGSLIAVSRNEAGDASGFGSKICRAPAGDLGAWSCAYDQRKYDSPLVFARGPDVYLIGRRNVSETGAYDLEMNDLSLAERYNQYQFDYWMKPKRCALWQIDPDALSVRHVVDLPSAGDTCFPESLHLAPGRELVFNSLAKASRGSASDPVARLPANDTSALGQAEDPSWLAGQQAPTSIYWTVVSLP